MDCPTQTIRIPVITRTQSTQPVTVAVLQENVKKTHELYQHALEAQAHLVFYAWINEQRALIDARIEKRAKQVAWALQGGPLRRRTDRRKEDRRAKDRRSEPFQQDTV